MDTLKVIKIGGNVVDDAAQLDEFLRGLARLRGPKILVHGGGKIATTIGAQLDVTPHYEAGRRITDAATLEVVTMVYGGLLNKRIVSKLQAAGCNAIGLSGCDGRLMIARKRLVREVDFGFVGDLEPDGVNVSFLQVLLEAGMVPVLAPLTHSDAEGLLNTNADTIAREVAQAYAARAAVDLIYCFEKKGLLRDVANEASVIPRVDEAAFQRLVAEGIVRDGMLPKLENAFAAIRCGVRQVTLGHAADLEELIAGTAGTQLR